MPDPYLHSVRSNHDQLQHKFISHTRIRFPVTLKNSTVFAITKLHDTLFFYLHTIAVGSKNIIFLTNKN
jgi:hypothetical protein